MSLSKRKHWERKKNIRHARSICITETLKLWYLSTLDYANEFSYYKNTDKIGPEQFFGTMITSNFGLCPASQTNIGILWTGCRKQIHFGPKCLGPRNTGMLSSDSFKGPSISGHGPSSHSPLSSSLPLVLTCSHHWCPPVTSRFGTKWKMTLMGSFMTSFSFNYV